MTGRRRVLAATCITVCVLVAAAATVAFGAHLCPFRAALTTVQVATFGAFGGFVAYVLAARRGGAS
jgi:hypothetical protein